MLRIESPPSGKHLWAASTPECHPFAFSRPSYVNVQFCPAGFFEAAHFSGCWGHSQPCQWALCCSVPSPVTPRKKPFLARVESLPVTSRSYARTDNYNLSITIYIIVASSWGQQLHGRMLPSAIIVIVANLCFFCSTVIM